MRNPNPTITEEFKECQYKAQGVIPLNQPLDKKDTQVKLPVSVAEAIAKHPARAAWLRRVIVKAAQEEGLI